MARLNVQADVRSRLQAALTGATVRVSVPDPVPLPLVVVRREGGRMADQLNDHAGIGVDVWARTEAEAADLAMAASEAILTLPLADGYSRKHEETLMSDYDTDRDLPHWYGSYTVNCYRPNTD